MCKFCDINESKEAMKLMLIAALIAALILSVVAVKDEFTEELYIKPLYTEQVLAHFQFSTKWDTNLTSKSCK